MKIAVFLPNWLGDVAMATPTLRAMRRHFGPQARIVGILRPYLADVLAGTPGSTSNGSSIPMPRTAACTAGLCAAANAGGAFDMAVLLTNSLRTAWRGMAGPGQAADRLRPLRPRPAVDRQALSPPRRPPVGSHADGRNVSGTGPGARLRRRIAPAGTGHAAGRRAFGRRRLPAAWPARRRAAWWRSNSSGAYGGSKLWPVEYFGQLARRIVDELDHDVLVICGPKERDIAREVVRLAGSGRRVLDGRPADGPGHGQGVHSPLPADGFDRQRAAARGRRLGPAGGHAVRPDAAHLERESHAAGDQSRCSTWTASAATGGPARWAIIAACAT